MKKIASTIIITGLLLIVFSGKVFCQVEEVKYDPRIKTDLDALGLTYEILTSGDFKLVYNVADNRTQMVIINSKTEEYGGMEIRKLWSVAGVPTDENTYPSDVLFAFLKLNAMYSLGAWEIAEEENQFFLLYNMRISVDTSQSILRELLNLSAIKTDEMEQNIKEEDNF